MGRITFFFIFLSLALPAAAQDAPSKPPRAKAGSVTTTYFGVDVADPYRYMENLNAPAVQAWISAQSEYARATLNRIPGRANLLAQLKKMEQSEPPRLGKIVVLPGDRYFYLKENSEEGSYDLYRRDGPSGKEVLLVDPDSVPSAGAANPMIASFAPSFDGHYVAYTVAAVGSQQATLRVMDAQTGKQLPDEIAGLGVGDVSWLPGNQEFFYTRLERTGPGAPAGQAGENARVYMHRLGTDPSTDVAVFGAGLAAQLRVPSGDIATIKTAPDSSYAVAAVRQRVDNTLIVYAASVKEIGKGSVRWSRIGNDNVAILNDSLRGNTLILVVNGQNGPVIARVSLQRPSLDNWNMMLQLSPEQAITGLQAVSDAVYATVREAGRVSLFRLPYNASAEILRAELPFAGSVHLYEEDPRAEGALVRLSSWTRAPAVYRYDARSDTVSRTNLWPSGPYDDPSGLVSVDVAALGSDGTFVPLTILYRKGLQQDGSHPTLLMGYGAYSSSSSLVPTYHPSWDVWLERGGILAFAHVGSADSYQNFITCARYLIGQGYTTASRLAAMAGGTGAILVGRAITTDPGLFRAVVIQSGLLDTLRSDNAVQFGNTSTLVGFRDLESVSSYAHVDPKVAYPATLLEAGVNDDGIPVWQSAKMAARLEADSSSGLPVLLSVEGNSDAAMVSSATIRRQRLADEISFLFWQLGEPGFQPPVPAPASTH